jgi:hypothetical protein
MRDGTTPDLSSLSPGSDEYKRAIDERDRAIRERKLTDQMVRFSAGQLLLAAMNTGSYPIAEPPKPKPSFNPQPTTPPPRPLRERKKLLARKLPGKGGR